MAPENLIGQGGPSSDIFAIGLILYEMLKGVPYFDGIDEQAVVQILRDKNKYDSFLNEKILS